MTKIHTPQFLSSINNGTIGNINRNYTNTDISQLRFIGCVKALVRQLVKIHPDTSQALNSFARFVVTDSYTAIASDVKSGKVNHEATNYIWQFLQTAELVHGNGIYNIGDTVLNQLLCNGDCMAEIVLTPQRIPSYLQPIPTDNLRFKRESGQLVPFLNDNISGIETRLDYPTVKRTVLNQEPDTPYASSFFESAVQAVIASEEYRNDLRRAFNRASLPRLTAAISVDEIKKLLPTTGKIDNNALDALIDDVTKTIETKLNSLNPQDAIVTLDSVELQYLTAENSSSAKAIETHAKIIDGLVVSGLKTLPSVVGRGEQASNTASTEALLFLKTAENIQNRINIFYSSLLTATAKLANFNTIVKFKFEKPNLRPEIELASFKAIEQSLVMEQLSLGFIGDDDASITLTGSTPTGNYTPLSGTRFRDEVKTEETANPYSNTSVSGKGVRNTPLQNTTKPDQKKPKTNKSTGK